MMRFSSLAALPLAAALSAAPASACAVHTPLNLGAIRAADVVVTGRALDYRQPSGHSGRFTLMVDEVVRGQAGRRLSVSLPVTLYGAPRALPRGRLLIALRSGGAAPGTAFTVMQGPCSPPFILEAGSAQASAARRLLSPGAR